MIRTISATMILFLGACQASPSCRVVGLELVSQTPEASEYALQVALTNPRDGAIALREWHFGGSCGGRPFDPTVWMSTRTLPANGTAQLSLPLILRGEPTASTAWEVAGEIVYMQRSKIAETIHDLGMPNPTIPFSGTGTITGSTSAPTAVNNTQR